MNKLNGMTKTSFALLGAGSWGTALAVLLADNGHAVHLWDRNAELLEAMQSQRENRRYLPGVQLPAGINISHDPTTALQAANLPLLVVPSSGFREVLKTHADIIRRKGKLVWATKGLEEATYSLLHVVAQEILGERMQLAVISGPNFAVEVGKRIPTATTIASNSEAFAAEVAQCLYNDWFRPYTSTDLIGVQLGGALKNVLAIAYGLADGLGLGANTRAALLTRGLAEITRLTVRMGGRLETLSGLAGVGDLVLTCTDNKSRNRRLGLILATGKSLDTALAEIGQAVEGVKTASAAHYLAEKMAVELPIIEQVYQVLFKGITAQQALKALLARELKTEQG
ncbi:MAG TPA: NAD(P)H-dependent glycerol-3-phosphate dehydrogenase [Gammaproteobacteria bacterium]